MSQKVPDHIDITQNMPISSSSKCLIETIDSKQNHKKEILTQNFICMSLLFSINLIKFMDRLTIAGILKETQDYFKIDDKSSGLLQTVFICSYMLIAPLFGYLGDRYPRKLIIIIGVSFWSSCTFLSSFVTPNQFWLFVIMRGLVGMGEASFSCMASAIIGDIFTSKKRTQMLSIFCMAIPLGSGLGYIVSSNISKLFNDWRWSLRFTPFLSIICITLFFLYVEEPKRGAADNLTTNQNRNTSTLLSDIVYLVKNKTFMFTTVAFTFSSFVLGGLAFWVPIYVIYAIESNNQKPIQIPLIFGVLICVSGVFGVVVSLLIAPKLRQLIQNKADPLICAVGSLVSVPALFLAIFLTRTAEPFYLWLNAFIAISALSLSWTMMADIQLYVIHPQKRSSAASFNILFCHLFGDASSPFLIGAVSDALRQSDSSLDRFLSLQTALFFGPVFAALSFVFFLLAVVFVDEDRKKVDDLIRD